MKEHIDEFRITFLILAVLYLTAALAPAQADNVYPENEWVWGCQIRGRSLNGACITRQFTKVGEADNDVDTDDPRVLGFEPGNVPLNRDGKPVWSRLNLSLFMKPGEVRIKNASTCKCGGR
jgi:hypothetical protein